MAAVTSWPNGEIACGAICQAQFPTSLGAQLVATPEMGSRFTGWSGACSGLTTCLLTGASSATVVAHFELNPRLEVSTSGKKTGRAYHMYRPGRNRV